MQPIPFGPGRFWDSSFYAGINNTMGLQDASNLGANYHFELPSATKVDLAILQLMVVNRHGSSKDQHVIRLMLLPHLIHSKQT